MQKFDAANFENHSIPFDSFNGSLETGISKYNFLLMSTSLLVDRVFLYTDLVSKLAESGSVTLWASSLDGHANDVWNDSSATVEPFPHVGAFREFPHNYLRRLNEYIWDYRLMPPSRLSMMKYRRDMQAKFIVRALKPPAKFLASIRTEMGVENYLERFLLSYPRSPEAEARLLAKRPDVIVTTGPFQFEQPAIFSVAKKLNIPMLAYIPSWDNISTKNRMVFNYDGYIVWNERTREELHHFYPRTKDSPVYVVGSPQFDVFHQTRFHATREEFCASQGLDPNLPILVYAIGSPNFLKEQHGAEHVARRVAEGHLGRVQLLVRPHPIHDNAEMREIFDSYGPRIRLQKTRNAGQALISRTQDKAEIVEWVNTFRHANVVINLSSTVTIDAAKFDKPVVNLDFDPQPSQDDQRLIKDVNHRWSHFKPVAESGGVWLVNSFEELELAVIAYLKDPSLHRNRRKWITEYVCGYLDGKCGARMANAIRDFIRPMN